MFEEASILTLVLRKRTVKCTAINIQEENGDDGEGQVCKKARCTKNVLKRNAEKETARMLAPQVIYRRRIQRMTKKERREGQECKEARCTKSVLKPKEGQCLSIRRRGIYIQHSNR